METEKQSGNKQTLEFTRKMAAKIVFGGCCAHTIKLLTQAPASIKTSEIKTPTRDPGATFSKLS